MLRLFIIASFLLMTPSLLMANDELKNALQNELRSEQDKARDVSRKPYETLNFETRIKFRRFCTYRNRGQNIRV